MQRQSLAIATVLVLATAGTASASVNATCAVSGPSGTINEITFEADGNSTSLFISVDFDNQGNFVYAGDLLIGIVAPNGNAMELGGGGMTLDGHDGITFTDAGSFPGSWNSENNGTYEFSIATDQFGLGGSGDWRLITMNGWAPSPGASWDGYVVMNGIDHTQARWTFNGTNWSSPSNWDPNIVPDAGMRVIFEEGEFPFPADCVLGGMRTVRDLVIDATISPYSFIDGTLRLQEGNIFVSSGDTYHQFDCTVEQLVDGDWDIEGADTSVEMIGSLSGSGSLTKLGDGALEFGIGTPYGVTHTISGDLVVAGGTVEFINDCVFPNMTLVPAGGSIVFSNDAEFGGLSGSGSLDFGNNLVTIGGNDDDTVFDGWLKGMGGMTKIGAGTLEVTEDAIGTDIIGPVTIVEGTFKTPGPSLFGADLVISTGATVEITGAGGLLGNTDCHGTLDLPGISTMDGSNLITGTVNGQLVVFDYNSTTQFSGTVNASDFIAVYAPFELQGGVINASFVDLQGQLTGSGTINGSVDLDGFGVQTTVSPGIDGDPIGLFTVAELNADSGTFIRMDLAGPTDLDQIIVTGDATLDGNLELAFADGFVAQPGHCFEIISIGGTQNGTFENVVFPDGQDWEIEYHANGVRVRIPGACDADLSGDGVVDTADLLALLANWGSTENDLNDDGIVDTADLLLLLSAWGACP